MEGQKVILLERANAIGTETSSRNSEVIHSGSLPIEAVSHRLQSSNGIKPDITHLHIHMTSPIYSCSFIAAQVCSGISNCCLQAFTTPQGV